MESTSLTLPTTPLLGRTAVGRVVLGCAIVTASLWDFRIATLRLFDFVSLALMATYFVIELDVRRDWLRRRAYILPFVTVMVAYAVYGYFDFHHRSSFAIILLSFLCLQFAGYRDVSWLPRLFRWIVYLHIAVQVVQYILFYVFGWVLDPQWIFGIQSRIFEGGGTIRYLRPAALFQEPNSYSLNLFMMTAVALVPRRDRPLALLAAGSMLVSESLWGIVGAFVLLALNEWNTGAHFLKKCGALFVVWLSVFVCFNGYLWAMKPKGQNEPFVYRRLASMSEDPSARDRYGELIDKTRRFECPECKEIPPAIGLSPQLAKYLGRGLSTAVFLSTVSANGYSFFWYCMGLVGLLFLAAAFICSLYGLSLQDQLYIAAAAVFAFTSYPLVTYVVFWLWLPLLILLARQKARNRSNPSPSLTLPQA